MRRFYRELDGAIYDRETGETIVPVIERDTRDGYEIREPSGEVRRVDREDIEEPQ